MKRLKTIYFIIGILLSLSSCNVGKTKGDDKECDSINIINSKFDTPENISDLKHEEMIFLVEGAVDSWFFYHLHDYRSYEPIIRSTDYNADGDYYIHKCRYRASTLGGGSETEKKIFKVTFDIDSQGMKDFHVEDITGHKSITEKEE